MPIKYPIMFAYVDRIARWWPPESIMSGIGMPGLTVNGLLYNYFALSFWTS